MSAEPVQACRSILAPAFQVPVPFRAFAVRSDEPQHAWAARSPCGWVRVVTPSFLDAGALDRLAAEARSRIQLTGYSEVVHARTSPHELSAAVPGVADLVDRLAGALALTGVLGAQDLAGYRHSLATRVDYLGTRGAGFHNDVGRHWSRSLFWLLVLHAREVDLVLPHAGLRLALVPGDLLVFDQTLAHGLCRPADDGQALAASFESGSPHDEQFFLTGELPLSDRQWAALGAPWLPVEAHEHRGALDLMVAQFDECSGAIQRPRTLLDSMRRSTCHVDGAP